MDAEANAPEQVKRIAEAEEELRKAHLEERDRYMDYLEAQQRRYDKEIELVKARH